MHSESVRKKSGHQISFAIPHNPDQLTMKLGLTVAAVSLAFFARAQLSDTDQTGISSALRIANVLRSETISDRAAHGIPVSSFQKSLLNEPLSAVDSVARLHAAGKQPLDVSLSLASSQCFGAVTPMPGADYSTLPLPMIPAPLRESVKDMIVATAKANARLRTLTAALNPDERRALIEGLPQWATGDPRVPFGFIKRVSTDPRPLLPLLQKIDIGQLRASGIAYVADMMRSTMALRDAARSVDIASPIRTKVLGVTIELSGRGNDRHTSGDSMISIDLGGDDVYSGRYGAGIGYASAVIDLSGNDRYEGGDANFGVGILGFGLCIDLAGRDTYDGGSITFGTGLAGVGVLWDASGDDRYHGVALTQGFGAYGIGILRDDSGRDNYDAGLRGQGSGRTQGLGWLIDQSGDDIYRLGGALGAKSSVISKNRGYGQGYGGGFDASQDQPGGIGLLTDFAGDDAYLGGVAVQGSASSGGLGSLSDQEGDDIYRARAKAQAYATDSSVGILIDGQGDDSYTVLTGPGLAFASRRSVACLMEGDGDDLYAARDARPSVAVDESFSMFIDRSGSDHYPGMPAFADNRADYDSLALFADLGGVDSYPEGLSDSSARSQTSRWVSLDISANDDVPAIEETWPVPGSAADPGDHQISELFRQAAVSGDARSLVAIGIPALQYGIDHELATESPANAWILVALANAMPQKATELLSARPISTESLRLIGDARLSAARDLVTKSLLSEATATEAAYAAGRLRMSEVTRLIVPLAVPGDRSRILTALTALAEIGNPDGLSAAQPYLASTDPALRAVSQRIVAQDPVRAIEIASVSLLSSESRGQRFAIELLGAVGTPKALSLIEPFLSNGSSETKIAALLAYRSRLPARLASALDKLRKDVDPLVRVVASGVDWEP